MADKKITALTDLGTALATTDLFNVVQDPSGTPINKKVSTANIFNNIPTWIALKQTVQAIVADGSSTTAPNVTTAITTINATAAAHSCALANGSDGQVKTIINVSTSGTNNVVITPANLRGYSTITLNAQGESVTLLFKVSKWNIIGGHGYAAA